ncbi:MAG: C-GCAxxG-C-C family (seleno)protein [Promethearchaeota archaeon]
MDVYSVYARAGKFATKFEEKFGSICCKDISGYDLTKPEEYTKYRENQTWEKTCHEFVLFAIDQVRKLTGRELRNKWE